jgi:hypothetical protein
MERFEAVFAERCQAADYGEDRRPDLSAEVIRGMEAVIQQIEDVDRRTCGGEAQERTHDRHQRQPGCHGGADDLRVPEYLREQAVLLVE